MQKMKFTSRNWKANFRMSTEKFTYLCEQLRQKIEPQTTNMTTFVCVEKEVAVTLWCLATAKYRTIAHLFGIDISTVCSTVQNTCQSLVNCLMSTYIQFSRREMLASVIEGFLIHSIFLSVREPMMVLINPLHHLLSTTPIITTGRVGILSFSKLLLTTGTRFEISMLAGLEAYTMQESWIILLYSKKQKTG